MYSSRGLGQTIWDEVARKLVEREEAAGRKEKERSPWTRFRERTGGGAAPPAAGGKPPPAAGDEPPPGWFDENWPLLAAGAGVLVVLMMRR